MEITRNVILDLLPLYLGDEVSVDTRGLIEKYLETDPELANFVKRSPTTEFLEDIPVPLTEEKKMEAYKEAKRIMLLRTVILTVAIFIVFLCLFGMALVWTLVRYTS